MRKERKMPRVLTNWKIKLGAYSFPDRKKIALCVEEGNEIVVCGYFTKLGNAEYFMDKLADLVGAEMEQESEQ